MVHQLDFQIYYRYETTREGIALPVVLSYGKRITDCWAKLDTGAEYCLFQRSVAELLDLEVDKGEPKRMNTLTGSLLAYGHTVTLQTFETSFDSLVYFAADYDIPRNLLGRHGWLQMLRIGLIDHDEMIYLSPYHNLE
jgi:hypothetical protein